jgi:SAM-dependent methyltransferase
VTPSSHILDVGCGIGRLAVAMPGFLDADGGYEGFDIVPGGIEWCQQHIVSPHSNVRFTLADVYNKEYNPKGRVQPADYRFPYPDGTFDVAVLISVFTHMLPPAVDRYVGSAALVPAVLLMVPGILLRLVPGILLRLVPGILLRSGLVQQR